MNSLIKLFLDKLSERIFSLIGSTVGTAATTYHAVQQAEQQSLLEDPLAPIESPSHSFIYQFTSGNKNHRHQIHDWEVQAAFRSYKRRYGDEDAALRMLHNEYQNNIPRNNLHFIMGTMAAHPKTFIVIGLLRSSLNPDEVARQPSLF